jgi:hypothetical protein
MVRSPRKSETNVTTPVRLALFSSKTASAVLSADASWKPRPGLAGTLTRFALKRNGVVEMAVQLADMNNCDIKNTCVGGVNDGVAYDPSDPCPSGTVFNEQACDCEVFEARWTGYSYHNSFGDAFFWTTGWWDMSDGKYFQWSGANAAFSGIFAPIGLQAPGYDPSIVVQAVGSCSGSSVGCKLYMFDAQGSYIRQFPFDSVFCECPTNYTGSHSPGCASVGEWEFR